MPESAYIQTPSQTVGPFFGFALPYSGAPDLVAAHDPAAIRLWGAVLDGAGDPVPDAMVEIWQADAEGVVPSARGSLSRDGRTFTGFGRAETGLDGVFRFTTVKPGAVKESAPYVLVTLFARGLSHHLTTRCYFAGDDHSSDAVLAAAPVERRSTLIATADDERSFRFDIRMQGENETVFLDFDA